MQSDMVCRAVFATLVAIFSRQEKNDGKQVFSVIYPQHPTLAYICARSMYRPHSGLLCEQDKFYMVVHIFATNGLLHSQFFFAS